MTPHRASHLALTLLVGAAGAGCSLNDNAMLRSDDAGVRVTVGDIDLALSSGGAQVTSGILGFYLSDQPDTCLAVAQAPVSRAVIFRVRVAAQTDGTTAATVVPPTLTPAPGQAVADIRTQTGGSTTSRFDGMSGTIAWSQGTSGSWSIDQLDVGFGGTTDRVQLAALHFPTCP